MMLEGSFSFTMLLNTQGKRHRHRRIPDIDAAVARPIILVARAPRARDNSYTASTVIFLNTDIVARTRLYTYKIRFGTLHEIVI